MKLFDTKFLLICYFIICSRSPLVAQISTPKTTIDFSAIDSWPNIGGISINNNGSYCGYYVNNQFSEGSYLYLNGISNKWHKELSAVKNYEFCDDNKSVVILKNDSLLIQKLGGISETYQTGIESFKLLQYKNREYLTTINNKNTFILFNKNTNKEIVIKGVTSYFQNKQKNKIFLITDINHIKSVSVIDLASFMVNSVCQGFSFENMIVDNAGESLAFLEQKDIWFYKIGVEGPRKLVENNVFNDILNISGLERFSQDGKNILFFVHEAEIPRPPKDAVMLDVWSTTDARLQSQQLHDLKPHRYLASIAINTGQIVQLQHKYEALFGLEKSKVDYLSGLRYNQGYDGEENWNSSGRYQNYLINMSNGKKQLMDFLPLLISPNGNYLIGVDSTKTNIVSYDRTNNITNQLTAKILVNEKSLNYTIYDKRRFEFQGWVNDKSKFIINDDFDLWLIDAKGDIEPINLTNGYGRKNLISFRITKDPDQDTILSDKDIKTITAFDTKTKQNGFYRLSSKVGGDPTRLFMGNYYFDFPTSPHLYSHFPIKAKDANVWLVQREQYKSSTNLFVTKDFNNFKSLSNFHPETKYNWLTAELVNYNSLNGEKLQGVLYKPENFDSTKRYPIIIYFYEKLSNKLNSFQQPDYTSNNINIPYFVSNGYVIFSPDINFVVGKPGESAYNSVAGAADFLSTYKWINSQKMGLYGHSFAGGLTNYIITRTNRFAAAVSSAGHTDLVSAAGSITLRDGTPADRTWIETDQGRIAATLWERPDLYIENSPVFHADKINTPLLMTNNLLDESTNFSQGLELFTSLRRLKKRAWMLQYDGETHGLIKLENVRDYTLRVQQFYNHFLMDQIAPEWIKTGIPASSKGFNKGY